jgi:hypothetical protein
MRIAIVVLLIALLTGVAETQRAPQLTWEGYVSGGADLFIHGESVDAQGRTTGAVDRPRIRFARPLPDAAQRVEMEVRRGGGRVLIVEQPSAANDFTLIVRLDPEGTEPEFYSLSFFWDAGAAERQKRAR